MTREYIGSGHVAARSNAARASAGGEKEDGMTDYPAWICADCGERWGRRPDKGNPESVTGRWSCNTYSSDLTQSYILAAEHERLMAERDAEIARMRDARILVLPGGLTGVCVGSRFGGWLMRRHPDGQWVSVVKLQEVDPTSANPAIYSLVGAIARAALGDDNG